MITEFWDAHSGGDIKAEPYEKIYIELPRDLAISYFEDRFGQDPYDSACDCCGPNYFVEEYGNIAVATKFHRGYEQLTVEEYLARPYVLFISKIETEGPSIG